MFFFTEKASANGDLNTSKILSKIGMFLTLTMVAWHPTFFSFSTVCSSSDFSSMIPPWISFCVLFYVSTLQPRLASIGYTFYIYLYQACLLSADSKDRKRRLVLSAGYLFHKRRANNDAELRRLLGLLKYTDGSTASMLCFAYLYIAGNGIERLFKTVSQLVPNGEQQAISRHLTICK